jgi:hypothetical protein
VPARNCSSLNSSVLVKFDGDFASGSQTYTSGLSQGQP